MFDKLRSLFGSKASAARAARPQVAMVLRRGPVLEHGQTFGPSADVKWSVRHASSKLVTGRDAIVLGIP